MTKAKIHSVDVRAYGAKGNDPNFDDAPGFANCIAEVTDEISGNKYAGARINLPRLTTFYLTYPITLANNIDMIGAGAAALPTAGGTIFAAKGPIYPAAFPFLLLEDCYCNRIENILLWGSIIPADKRYTGIKLGNAAAGKQPSAITIRNV